MSFHRWFIRATSRLVPKGLRREWREEWDAELDHQETRLRRLGPLKPRDRRRLLRDSTGALWDALWLQSNEWHAVRFLVRHRRVTAPAVVSLAAALAATIVVLGVSNALLLRPPGVGQPDRLLTLYVHSPQEGFDAVSWPDYRYFRDHNTSFSGLAAFALGISWTLPGKDAPLAHLVYANVSDNYFDVLGVHPIAGTLTFPGAATDTAVMSEALWRHLGADPGLVGRTVPAVGNRRVIGVAPASFRGMSLAWQPDAWFPFDPGQTVNGRRVDDDRGVRWLRPVGRLRANASAAAAESEIEMLSNQLAAAYPDTDRERRAFLTPTTIIPADGRPWVTPLVAAFLGVAVLILLVAVANVTSLLLGLAATRRHEMLVRAALGATRWQLMGPPLREGATLAAVAGAAGGFASWIALRALSTNTFSLSADIPPLRFDFAPDWIVVAAAAATIALTALGVSLLPAWRAAVDGLTGTIARDATGDGRRRARLRNALVVAQIAATTAVLVAVGVTVRSLSNARHTDLGFAARDLVVADLDTETLGSDQAARRALYDRVRDRIAGLAGVRAVALADSVPISDCCQPDRVQQEDAAPGDDRAWTDVRYAVVDPAYFSTLGIRTIAGRTFGQQDATVKPEAVVVNQTLARRLWPNEDAVGRRMRLKNNNRLAQITAVVADGKYTDLDEPPTAFVYLPLAQHDPSGLVIIGRTSGPADVAAVSVRAILREFDVPTLYVQTFAEALRASLAIPTLIAHCVAGAGAFAALLAVVGLYGTVFYAMSQRRREIAIRQALGAKPRDVFAIALRQAALLALGGGLAGALAGEFAMPVLGAWLYGIRPVEPLVLAGVTMAVTGAALAIAYGVVRPLNRMSPQDVLRT